MSFFNLSYMDKKKKILNKAGNHFSKLIFYHDYPLMYVKKVLDCSLLVFTCISMLDN